MEFDEFNQGEGEGLGSAFFGTIEQFEEIVNLLDEEGKTKMMEEMFEVGFMDKK